MYPALMALHRGDRSHPACACGFFLGVAIFLAPRPGEDFFDRPDVCVSRHDIDWWGMAASAVGSVALIERRVIRSVDAQAGRTPSGARTLAVTSLVVYVEAFARWISHTPVAWFVIGLRWTGPYARPCT